MVICDFHIARPGGQVIIFIRHLPDKEMRHWSLMRMLCCPLRSRFKASSRFPGGTRRLPRLTAALSCSSFRSAVV